MGQWWELGEQAVEAGGHGAPLTRALGPDSPSWSPVRRYQ